MDRRGFSKRTTYAHSSPKSRKPPHLRAKVPSSSSTQAFPWWVYFQSIHPSSRRLRWSGSGHNAREQIYAITSHSSVLYKGLYTIQEPSIWGIPWIGWACICRTPKILWWSQDWDEKLSVRTLLLPTLQRAPPGQKSGDQAYLPTQSLYCFGRSDVSGFSMNQRVRSFKAEPVRFAGVVLCWKLKTRLCGSTLLWGCALKAVPES